MITRELLKKEIDNVRQEYMLPLYKIIKTFEYPGDINDVDSALDEEYRRKEDWNRFLEKYAGCLSDTPIQRGNQGKFESRGKLSDPTT
jgi:hypothetical protein